VHDALTSTPIFVIRPPRCQGAVGWVSVGGDLSVNPFRRGSALHTDSSPRHLSTLLSVPSMLAIGSGAGSWQADYHIQCRRVVYFGLQSIRCIRRPQHTTQDEIVERRL